ncbi:MAG: endonuclease domain-containing protein [Pleurocapsa sp.]
MKPRNIIIGQKVTPEKVKFAQELRQNMTPAEKILWQYLRAKRFQGFKFRRQQIIEGFIVDFYCHSLGLVIEVDGKIHDRQKDYDADRDKIIAAKGLFILRFTNQQVTENIESVLKTIAEKSKDIEGLKPFSC